MRVISHYPLIGPIIIDFGLWSLKLGYLNYPYTCKFANVGLTPLPTDQMTVSGGCSFQGHSPVSSSNQMVPKA